MDMKSLVYTTLSSSSKASRTFSDINELKQQATLTEVFLSITSSDKYRHPTLTVIYNRVDRMGSYCIASVA